MITMSVEIPERVINTKCVLLEEIDSSQASPPSGKILQRNAICISNSYDLII